MGGQLPNTWSRTDREGIQCVRTEEYAQPWPNLILQVTRGSSHSHSSVHSVPVYNVHGHSDLHLSLGRHDDGFLPNKKTSTHKTLNSPTTYLPPCLFALFSFSSSVGTASTILYYLVYYLPLYPVLVAYQNQPTIIFSAYLISFFHTCGYPPSVERSTGRYLHILPYIFIPWLLRETRDFTKHWSPNSVRFGARGFLVH